MKKVNMASVLGIFCTSAMAILAAMSVGVIAVKEFKVGGKGGWMVPDATNTAMYSQWAERHRFHIGDSLTFEYNNDSVLVVDKYDYYHCNTTEPITAFSGGNRAIVKLDRPGPFYFISGAPDHCNNGQRLLVDVMSPHRRHPIAPSPPSVAFPPETDKQGPSPSPSTSSGVVVSATLSSVSRVLIAGFVTFLWSPLL